MAFKIRRGTNAERQAYTPAIGEPIWTTDTKKLWIGDGITAGGIAVDAESYLTDEYLQDLTAAMFTSGGHTGITFAYNDDTGKIIATVNFPPVVPTSGNFHFNVTGSDSTLKQINASETIQFTGSNGINVTVNDTGPTTIINVDGFAVTGGGGDANLEDVGWFVTGSDSTQTRIYNDETLQFLGANGISISVDDTLAPARLTITSPIPPNADAAYSIPYHDGFNTSTLNNGAADLRFMAEYGTLEVNRIAANSFISVLITDPFNILNIQPNTPTVGRATVTFAAHPHPPFYNGRQVEIENVGGLGASWNGIYNTRPANEGQASTTTTVIIVSSNTDAYTFGGTIHEASTTPFNFISTGSDPYLLLGGVLDLQNGMGLQEYCGRLRLIDNLDHGANNLFASQELISVQNQIESNGIHFIRARGSLLAPAAVQNGDELGSIRFSGDDQLNNPLVNQLPFVHSAEIIAVAKSNPSIISGDPNLAGELRFNTARVNSGYNTFTGLIIDEVQTVKVPSTLEVSDTIRISGNTLQTIVSNANLDVRTNGTGVINLLENVNITGTLNVPTIDTSDSSAINITPAAIFASDVTVQNDLNVSNKIYATEFVSTSGGSAEIFSATNFKIRVSNREWLFATTGDIGLPNGSQLTGNSWTAAASDYVLLQGNSGDNSLTVGDTTVVITTNANTVSRNFYFNLDGGLQLPIINAAPASPNRGFYTADGVSWDPASKAGAVPYPVFYDGVAFNALY